ncbi:MAG: tetratricopeptide repeat protein [Ktedonobacteraceae bacterium]|nr:tetratricopeptide repeat protein [Ktedonobacteraceae bacterium]
MTANEALRRARARRGWSQAMLAQRLDTSSQNIGRWERGETRPSPYFCEKLCELFEVDTEALGLLEPAPLTASETPIAVPELSWQEPILDPMRPRFSIPLTQVIGRQGLLDDLFTHLQNRTNCVLYGLPGVGKTTLAQLLSQDARCQHLLPDGLLWVSLGPQPDVHTELLRLAAILHAPEDERRQARSTQELVHYVQRLIGEKRLLLVIDDAWRVEEARCLLLGAPQIACLVTTRLPEVAMTLSEAQPIPVPELDMEQSYGLLTQLAPHLAQSPPKTVQQVLQYTGGLPLALTVLGSYLRMQSIGGQSRRIETALAQLSDASLRLNLVSPQRAAMQRPIQPEVIPWSLATIISISEQHLLPAARHAMRALAILPAKPESFSEAAALAVCGSGLDILDVLLDAGLVEGAGEGRYCIHQVIADYAQLQQQETTPGQRLVDYGQQMCASFNVKEEQRMQHMTSEYPVVLAALQVALTRQQTEDVILMVLALVPFWRTQGLYQQAEQWLQAAQAMTTAEKPGYARLLAQRAQFALLREAWEQAQQDALAGLELSVAPEQHEVHATCLLTLGLVAQQAGNDTQARAYYEKGLHLARSGRDGELPSRFLRGLGNLALMQGEYQQAQVLFQEGLALAQQGDQLELMCQLLSNVGKALQLQGDYAHAEQRLREGLALARRLGYRTNQILLLLYLGVTLCQQGKTAQGKALFLEGLALARQSEDHGQIKRFLMNLGAVAFEEDAYEEAEHYFQEALVEARESQDLTSCIVLLTNIGVACGERGAFEEAQRAFEECLPLTHQLGDPWLLSNALCARGEVSLQAHQVDEAEHWFQEALAVYQDREPNRELVTMSRFGLAQVESERGRLEEARQVAEQCLQVFVEMNHRTAEKVRAWLDRVSPTTASIEEGARVAAQEEGDSLILVHEEVDNKILVHEEQKSMPVCPHCQNSHAVRKRGKSRSGAQRYQCAQCHHDFTPSVHRTMVPVDPRLPEQARLLAAQGKSLRAIARELGLHHTTVMRWLNAISEPIPPAY